MIKSSEALTVEDLKKLREDLKVKIKMHHDLQAKMDIALAEGKHDVFFHVLIDSMKITVDLAIMNQSLGRTTTAS